MTRQEFLDYLVSLSYALKNKKTLKEINERLDIYINEYLREIACLQAKVLAYEEIIKKSNFKPFVEKVEEVDVRDIL